VTAERAVGPDDTARVVLVTGGSLGIGREIARAFCQQGDRVVVTARGAEDLQAAVEDLAGAGGSVESAVCDVTDDRAVGALLENLLERYGRVDVLVNNAGIYGPIGPLVDNDIESWCQTVEINLLGLIRITKSVLPQMIARGSGAIINLSGGGATGPKPGYSAYAASKTAVVRLTEVLAHELASSGIRVNAIAPGFVATRLHDQTLAAGPMAPDRDKVAEKLQGGGDDPRRAAELAVFLASDRAAGVSGRLISAIWDDWADLAGRSDQLAGSDLYTLRRIDNMFFTEVSDR